MRRESLRPLRQGLRHRQRPHVLLWQGLGRQAVLPQHGLRDGAAPDHARLPRLGDDRPAQVWRGCRPALGAEDGRRARGRLRQERAWPVQRRGRRALQVRVRQRRAPRALRRRRARREGQARPRQVIVHGRLLFSGRLLRQASLPAPNRRHVHLRDQDVPPGVQRFNYRQRLPPDRQHDWIVLQRVRRHILRHSLQRVPGAG